MSLEQVKKLRELTSAGMVECQKALREADNDLEKAVEILRKKGISKAAKRHDREAREGVIRLDLNSSRSEGYMVEINAETDFVARNEKFQQFADSVIDVMKKERPESIEKLMDCKMDKGTVSETLDNLSGIIGEKLKINNLAIITSSGTVAAYSHMGGKIGVLVALDKPGEDELAANIAMQTAASHPKYIYPEDVPENILTKEKEIYREQIAQAGKPENIIEKIVAGKVQKYYQEVCLVKQEYIKDDKKLVSDILGDVKVEKFIRFSTQ